jgi:mono/diheme cytochrome c family protein
MRMRFATISVVPFAVVMTLRSILSGQEAPKSVLDGVYTHQQADRGKTAYVDACASCHGEQLAGGETAPALTNTEFATNWDGLTVGDLFERVQKSMPQNAPASLSGQQYADIIAYILSANKFPAGVTELPTDSASLKMIKYELKKSGE